MPRLAAEHPFFFLDASPCFFQRRRSAVHVRRCVYLRRCRGLTENVTARAAGCLVAGAVAHLRSAYGKGGASVPHAPSAAASCGWGYEECRTAGAKRRVVFFVGMQCDAWRCRGRLLGLWLRLAVETVLRALMMLEL